MESVFQNTNCRIPGMGLAVDCGCIQSDQGDHSDQAVIPAALRMNSGAG